MRGRVAFVVLCAVVAAPRLARADWFYRWWCTGQCAPDSLDTHGTVGPFSSESDCESVRASDPHNGLATTTGDLANVDSCYESDHEDATSSGGGGGTHVNPGIGRLYGGPALVGVSDLATVEGTGGGIGGFQFARGAVPGHHLYPWLDFSYAQIDLKHADTGMSSTLYQFDIVMGGEYTIGSGALTGFVQLGGGLVFVGMDDKSDWFGVKGGAGLDLSLSDGFGLVLFGAGIATPSLPGSLFVGLGIETRSERLIDARHGG